MTQQFSKKQLEALDALSKRWLPMQVSARRCVERATYGFDTNVSEPQRRFLDDHSRKVLLCTGRRAGKTFAILVRMFQVVLGKENALCWYIAPSRQRAKDILWDYLKGLNAQYSLGAEFNEVELTATFPTGSRIRLTGCPDVYASGKLRGIQADIFAVDEAQEYRETVLEKLIDEAIVPAAAEFPDAQIILAGTPNTKQGYFYKADVRNVLATTWSCHTWNVLENPYYPLWVKHPEDWRERAVQFLADEREAEKLSEDNGRYQREYLGNWAAGDSWLYYSEFNLQRNTISLEKIQPGLKTVIGCDFGIRIDPSAFVVWAFDERVDRKCYIIECLKVPSPTTVENICFRLKKLIDEYQPEAVVGDYAGIGEAVFQRMYEHFNVDVQDAKKADKAGTNEFIQSDLHEGLIIVADHLTDLIKEFQTVEWDTKKRKPDPSFPNDCLDAAEYSYSQLRNYLYQPPKPQKTPQQIIDEQLQSFFDREDRIIEKRRNMYRKYGL